MHIVGCCAGVSAVRRPAITGEIAIPRSEQFGGTMYSV